MLEVELDKFFQVADWRIRPLPKGMLDYARCDSHYLIPIYAQFQVMLAQPPLPRCIEESKSDKATPLYFNSIAVPLQAFRELSSSGNGPTGLYFSEDIQAEEWFQQLRKLSHKRSLTLFSAEEKDGVADINRFSGLSDLAEVTNRYIAQKLLKNNFKRVNVEF